MNAINTEVMIGHMLARGIDFDLVQGVYKGVREQSFIVDSKQFDAKLKRFVFSLYKQESALYIDSVGNAMLQYSMSNGGNAVKLGAFSPVGEMEAKQRVAYTKIGSVYYVCK
jgi:hypothetical protein